MADFDEGCSHSAGEEHGMKALWVALQGVERKIDNLTLEIRQSLSQLNPNHPPPFNLGMKDWDFARPPPLTTRAHTHPFQTRSEPPDLSNLSPPFHSHTPNYPPRHHTIDQHDFDDDVTEAFLYEELRRRNAKHFGEPRMGHQFGHQPRYNRA